MSEHLHWYKGNLHMHSFWSDGVGFPEVIAGWFKDQGYHFIAFTEHDRLQDGPCWISTDPGSEPGSTIHRDGLLKQYLRSFGEDWVQRRTGDHGEEVRIRPLEEYRERFEEPGRFLIMTGEEISTTWGAATPDEKHWINAYNLEAAIPPPPPGPDSRGAIATVVEIGAASAGRSKRPVLVSVNHPNFSWNATAEDLAAVESLRFMEMHTALNSCECAGDALHCSVERIWDIVLTLRLTEPGGAPIFGMATDDCHGYGAGHPVLGAAALPGRAWVMIRAGTLSATDLIDALEHGDFYCSSGVTLRNVERDGDGLRVEIDPVPGLRYRTRFIGTRRGYDPERRPVVDADGRTVRTTASYSDEVGSVFAETDDLAPTYRFEGDELYVRAVVTSDEDHHNPSWPGQKTQAWTQPAMP